MLGLCDEAFGEEGVRDATWPWLRDEAGELFVADGWWPEARIAAVLAPAADPSTIERLGPILRTLDAHGELALPLTPELWPQAGAQDQLARLRDALAGEDGRGQIRDAWGLNVPPVGHWFVATTFDGWDDAEDYDDDDWSEEPDDTEDLPDLEPPPHALPLGWRTRPTLLALLGAAALTRRAAELVDPRVPRDDTPAGLQMQILGALGLHAADGDVSYEGASVTGIVTALAAEHWEVLEALDPLLRTGLAAKLDAHDTSDTWVKITPEGIDVLLAWVHRCGPLVGDWPDEPTVDDAS